VKLQLEAASLDRGGHRQRVHAKLGAGSIPEVRDVRIGLMIGPEKGRYREKVGRLVSDAQAAERAGFTSIWVPGATDLAARVLALGSDRAARVESRRRTEAFLASLCPRL
jgi:hypothetical protein